MTDATDPTHEAAMAVVDALGMAAHPEGGWYVERWRAPAGVGGERPAASAILYLLAAGERSHWHRVDAAEVWQWSGGDPLELRVWADGDATVAVVRLGGDARAGGPRRPWSRPEPGRPRDRSARGRSSAASSRRPSSSPGSSSQHRIGTLRSPESPGVVEPPDGVRR